STGVNKIASHSMKRGGLMFLRLGRLPGAEKQAEKARGKLGFRKTDCTPATPCAIFQTTQRYANTCSVARPANQSNSIR
ncbi:MAG: hypothetical protein RSE54_08470, partial [Ruthenibacterium sp.]